MAQSSINVTASGASPVATFTQTQGGTTVNIQQMAPVDSVTGTAVVIDSNGSMHTAPYLGTPQNSGPLTATVAGGGGSTATLTSGVLVSTGKVATLQHAIFSANTACSWTIQTVNASGTPTSICTVNSPAGGFYDFKPGMIREIATVAGDNVHVTFQVICTNLDPSSLNTANANAYFNWAEN